MSVKLSPITVGNPMRVGVLKKVLRERCGANIEKIFQVFIDYFIIPVATFRNIIYIYAYIKIFA